MCFCGVCVVHVFVCVVCVYMCLCVGVYLSFMVVCRLVKHLHLYMRFVALLDHHNSKIKIFRENGFT